MSGAEATGGASAQEGEQSVTPVENLPVPSSEATAGASTQEGEQSVTPVENLPVLSSEATAGASAQEGQQNVTSVENLPVQPNLDIDEKLGRENCTIEFQYQAMEGDQVVFRTEDRPDGQFHLLFTVRRAGSDAIVYQRKSKPIRGDWKDNLIFNKDEPGKLNVKKRTYRVLLKKKGLCKNEYLAPFFRPESPPA